MRPLVPKSGSGVPFASRRPTIRSPYEWFTNGSGIAVPATSSFPSGWTSISSTTGIDKVFQTVVVRPPEP